MKKKQKEPKAKNLWYELRDAALLRNGFPSYKAYLKSDLWKSIRARVLERDSHTCFVCKGRAFQVHHRSYGDVTLRGDKIDKLISVCRGCHLKIEFNRGNKRAFGRTNDALKDLVKKRGQRRKPKRRKRRWPEAYFIL